MKNKTLAGVFILLVAMFLVACRSLPKPEKPPSAPQTLLSISIDTRLLETRYCGKTERDPKVVAAFRRIHACPATGLTTGACPDWQVDHLIPRDSGGCHMVGNLQWLPVWLKTCAGYCKDRWERKIYCKPVEEGGTGCVNSIIEPKE